MPCSCGCSGARGPREAWPPDRLRVAARPHRAFAPVRSQRNHWREREASAPAPAPRAPARNAQQPPPCGGRASARSCCPWARRGAAWAESPRRPQHNCLNCPEEHPGGRGEPLLSPCHRAGHWIRSFFLLRAEERNGPRLARARRPCRPVPPLRSVRAWTRCGCRVARPRAASAVRPLAPHRVRPDSQFEIRTWARVYTRRQAGLIDRAAMLSIK